MTHYTTPTAVLFPGQGSQTAGMRRLVARVRPDLLAAATELVGEDPFPRVHESTRFAQPAIFCASLAGWTQLRERMEPIALAGHSLGEITALAAAGALDEHDALALVVLRGHLMEVSSLASGDGRMLALLDASPAQAADLAARHDVTLANDNAPGMVVLSGAPGALTAADRDARSDGLRVRALDVACAFHSPQMRHAVTPLREALDEVRFRAPRIAVHSSASTRPFRDPRGELARALVRPVRWRETMIALARAGAATFIDAGPGETLARLAARCVPGLGAASLERVFGMPDSAAA